MKKFNLDEPLIKSITSTTPIYFFFDYDGTLSPLVANPDDASLPKYRQELLYRIQANPNYKLAIVTGRSYEDIAPRLDVSNMVIAASHGYDIRLNDEILLQKGAEFHGPIRELGQDVYACFGKIPGVYIEQKKLSMAFHYRNVDDQIIDQIATDFDQLIAPYLTQYNFEKMTAKKLWEIRPKNYWDKGQAVIWLMNDMPDQMMIAYFGDDTTDEDAFKILDDRSISVHIGDCDTSHAKYYVNEFDELLPWYQRILV